jgi:hypothetical protein
LAERLRTHFDAFHEFERSFLVRTAGKSLWVETNQTEALPAER